MTIKTKIIRKLNAIEDEDSLKEIHDWLEAFIQADPHESFNTGEVNAVQEGYAQYLAGKTISHSEASKQFDEWLRLRGK